MTAKKTGASTALTGEAPQTETSRKYHRNDSGRQDQKGQVGSREQQENDSCALRIRKEGRFYKPLPVEFQSRGFNYHQIAREGDMAIYEQRWNDSPNVCYEVVRLRRREAETFPDGRQYPAREVYPSSEQWGQHGWTVLTRDAAFDKLTQQISPGQHRQKPILEQSGQHTATEPNQNTNHNHNRNHNNKLKPK